MWELKASQHDWSGWGRTGPGVVHRQHRRWRALKSTVRTPGHRETPNAPTPSGPYCVPSQAGGEPALARALLTWPQAYSLPSDPNARIEPGVGDIDYNVDHDDERRGEEHHRLGNRVVSDEHGIHQQSANTRPGEDGLGHHSTRDELCKIHGKQRENRHGGVLQSVLPN